MVKKIRLKDLEDISIENRLTVVFFYSKGCAVCKRQEGDIEKLEKQLTSHGVIFVKLELLQLEKDLKKLPNEDGRRGLKVDVVPTIMMWVPRQDGQGNRWAYSVGFVFEKGGRTMSQINGFITVEKLLKTISAVLENE